MAVLLFASGSSTAEAWFLSTLAANAPSPDISPYLCTIEQLYAAILSFFQRSYWIVASYDARAAGTFGGCEGSEQVVSVGLE
jgi:hypothetical protein